VGWPCLALDHGVRRHWSSFKSPEDARSKEVAGTGSENVGRRAGGNLHRGETGLPGSQRTKTPSAQLNTRGLTGQVRKELEARRGEEKQRPTRAWGACEGQLAWETVMFTRKAAPRAERGLYAGSRVGDKPGKR